MGSAAESFYLHNYFKLAGFQPLTVILRFSFGSQSDKSGDYEFKRKPTFKGYPNKYSV